MTNLLNDTRSALSLLLTRRSSLAMNLVAPGPSCDELNLLLTSGMRVPDHGKLTPWRIQIIQGDATLAFADYIDQRWSEDAPEYAASKRSVYQKFNCECPLILVVTSSPDSAKFEKIPLLEQQLSGGALCQNLLLAAHAQGYAAQWLTGWPARSAAVKAFLGHSEDTDILGFIYIGTATIPVKDRPRPSLENIVSEWLPH